jgi:hypothetical protein
VKESKNLIDISLQLLDMKALRNFKRARLLKLMVLMGCLIVYLTQTSAPLINAPLDVRPKTNGKLFIYLLLIIF